MKHSIFFAVLLAICSCSPTEPEPIAIDPHAYDRFWIETKKVSAMEWTFILHSHSDDLPTMVGWNIPNESGILSGDSVDVIFTTEGIKPVTASVITKAADTILLSTHVLVGNFSEQAPSPEFFANAKVKATFWGDHVRGVEPNTQQYDMSSFTSIEAATVSKVEDTLIYWSDTKLGRTYEMHFAPGRNEINSLKMSSYSHSETTDWIQHFEELILLPQLHFEGANDTMAIYSYEPIGDASSGHPEFDFVYYSYSVHVGKSGSGTQYQGTNWNNTPKPLVQVRFTRMR